MRQIFKRGEPEAFTAWKGLANENWAPTYSGLGNPLKAMVHAALLQEQGRVCCYCEQAIALDTSHIEHLIPRSSGDGAADVDFQNMLASCQRQRAGALHCGQFRGNRPFPVQPTLLDCAVYFDFGSNGAIGPSTDPERRSDGATTIAVLGLDSEALNARRRVAIRGIEDLLEAGSPDEVSELIPVLLAADAEGRYLPHATALVGILRRVGRPAAR